jgi:hypothetical protein
MTMRTAYVVDKAGCHLEVTDTSVNVRIWRGLRGSIAIPLSSIRAVGTARFRSTRVIHIETPDGLYEWALGDRAAEAARAIAIAAGIQAIAEPVW